ncbi:MAG: phosphatase PAP2 family protein [Sphaerochaetaceae bacterium]|nr:phosphatase PAP2 family protein [Spirochaetales bacterium]MDY5498919.1 phosphatase PAP2 family protein [Sphaerochaetaceae bacterium]
MQASILLFFQEHANPFLDWVFELITMFGEEGVILLIALAIYWCVDKRRGFSIASCLLFSLSCSMVVKAIVRLPRPFQVLSSIKGKRVETATGYSFPSGHSTAASAFYGATAFAFPRPLLIVSCSLLVILVPLSRVYLGVHWPLDVIGGMIIGLGTVLCSYRTFSALEGKILERFTLTIGLGTLAVGLASGILLQAGAADPVAFGDLVSTFNLFSGFYLGVSLESRHVGFSCDCKATTKLLRYLGGVAGILLIMALKKILPAEIYALGKILRYLLLGLWVTFLWPLWGRKLRIF